MMNISMHHRVDWHHWELTQEEVTFLVIICVHIQIWCMPKSWKTVHKFSSCSSNINRCIKSNTMQPNNSNIILSYQWMIVSIVKMRVKFMNQRIMKRRKINKLNKKTTMKTKMQILQLSNQKVKIKEGKKKWLNRKMLKCLSWRTKKIREINS